MSLNSVTVSDRVISSPDARATGISAARRTSIDADRVDVAVVALERHAGHRAVEVEQTRRRDEHVVLLRDDRHPRRTRPAADAAVHPGGDGVHVRLADDAGDLEVAPHRRRQERQLQLPHAVGLDVVNRPDEARDVPIVVGAQAERPQRLHGASKHRG